LPRGALPRGRRRGYAPVRGGLPGASIAWSVSDSPRKPSPQTARRRRPKKYLVVFFVMAILGTNLEIAARVGELVQYKDLRLSPASLAGWTSLWMLPIYGIAGVAFGFLNETRVRNLRMIYQCLLALLIAWSIELASGLVLNVAFGLAVWDYSPRRFNLLGQISLATGIQFFFIAPLAFWLDDLVRYLAYDEPRPDRLASYYRRLFTLR
jgi:hypothetical protein